MPTVYVRLDGGTSYAEHPTLDADTIAIGGELGTLRRAARRVPAEDAPGFPLLAALDRAARPRVKRPAEVGAIGRQKIRSLVTKVGVRI